MKKTKKDFLENYSSCPELAKKVFNKIGHKWNDIKQQPYDYANASGGVSGFIYYTDTVPFAKRNMELIQDALYWFEKDCGTLEKDTETKTMYYNWLSWFALEHVVHELISYLEQ